MTHGHNPRTVMAILAVKLLLSSWAVGVICLNEVLITRMGCFSTEHLAVTLP